MIKKATTLLLALTMTSALAACSTGTVTTTTAGTTAAGTTAAGTTSAGTTTAGTTAPGTTTAGTKSPADYKMVLILPGPINDQSWNATNYAGLVESNEKLGTKMEYVENVQATDYESTFREYAERGYDLIMAAGSQFDEAAGNVAANYPKSMFTVVNGSKAELDNVAPIFPKEYEASYLAAIIAGHITKNGKFATIGGFPNQPMEDLLDVYEKTAVKIAKDKGLTGAVANRAYANSWDDVALGKQMAEQMIDSGADTLFIYANQVGLGSIEAAKAKGAKVVGFSSDQTTIDPATVTSSILFDFKTFYAWAVKQYMDGKLTGKMVHEAGIAEGIFKPVYTDNITQDIKEAVQKGIDDYKAGTVDLKALFTK